MIQRVLPSPYISANRWMQRFPTRQYASRWSQIPTSPSHSITTSAVDMAPSRSRPSVSRRKQFVFIQQVERKSSLFVRIVTVGLFLLGGYGAYETYMYIKSIRKALRVGADKISGVLADAKGKVHQTYMYTKPIREGLRVGAGKISDVLVDAKGKVRDTVGPAVKRTSEKLPEHMQKASEAIKGAGGGVQSAVKSNWEWIRKEVEERRK